MKLFHIHKRFLLMMNAISILVAFLMHLPELIALSEPEAGSRLFPDVHWANVSYEILFTYLSTVLLFFLNIGMMRLNKPTAELSWRRVAVTFVVTLVACWAKVLFMPMNISESRPSRPCCITTCIRCATYSLPVSLRAPVIWTTRVDAASACCSRTNSCAPKISSTSTRP